MAASEQGRVLGAIDLPEPGANVHAGLVRLTGWVFDTTGTLVSSALVAADHSVHAHVRLGVHRPDVAAHFPHLPVHEATGFEVSLDLRTMASGPVQIALLARTSDGHWHEAATTTIHVVSPERPRDGARSRAAFTIVHDEPIMLPLWLRHYARTFAPEDLYVLAHDSPEDEHLARAAGVNVVPVHRSASFDHHWLKTTVERFQRHLLSSYETVLFAEADELVIADPLKYGSLGEFLDAFDGKAVRCTGFEVVEQPGERPLRFEDSPYLAQRSRWHASRGYSKRLGARFFDLLGRHSSFRGCRVGCGGHRTYRRVAFHRRSLG